MNTTSEGSEAVSCPKCGSTLVQGNASFYVRGEYLGDFESVICKNSHFSALTESGYKDAITIAEQRGLIGPVEERIEAVTGIGKNYVMTHASYMPFRERFKGNSRVIAAKLLELTRES